MNYDKKFSDTKHKLTSFMRLSNGLNDGNNEFYNTPVTDNVSVDRARDGSDGTNKSLDFQLDYVRPIEKGSKLEIGLSSKITDRGDEQLSYAFNESLKLYELDSDYSNKFVYEEAVHAAYVQYSRNIWLFNVNAGGRYETVTMLSELINTNEKFENPYSSFYPSLSMSFGAPQLLQIQTSYSKRVNRPRSRQLNPFLSKQDARNFRKGNPFLKPEYTDSYEINFGRFSRGISINLGAYYRYTTDEIERFKQVNEDGTSIATYANIDEERTKGIEYNLVGTLRKNLRLMLSGSVYWDEINSDLFGQTIIKRYKAKEFALLQCGILTPRQSSCSSCFTGQPLI